MPDQLDKWHELLVTRTVPSTERLGVPDRGRLHPISTLAVRNLQRRLDAFRRESGDEVDVEVVVVEGDADGSALRTMIDLPRPTAMLERCHRDLEVLECPTWTSAAVARVDENDHVHVLHALGRDAASV